MSSVAVKYRMLVEEIHENLTYEFGRYVIPERLVIEIRDYLKPKKRKLRIGYGRKFSDAEVDTIRKKNFNGYSIRRLAEEYQVSTTTIWYITNGRHYKVRKDGSHVSNNEE